MYRNNKYIEPLIPEVNEKTEINDKESLGVVDEDWVRLSLMTDISEFDGRIVKHLYKSNVMMETQGTGVGEGLAVNMPYGFSPNADCYYDGRLAKNSPDVPESRSIDIGMGRYYHEAIHQHSEVRTLVMTFGVPNFKSFFTFMLGSVDYAKSVYAREARSPFWYTFGNIIGETALMTVFPSVFLVSHMVKTAASIIVGSLDPRYYSLKPDMAGYLGSVNAIVNSLAVERNIINLTDKVVGKDDDRVGVPIEIDSEDFKELSVILPHIFKKNIFGHEALIDVMGISGKYQMIVNKQYEIENLFLDYTPLLNGTHTDSEILAGLAKKIDVPKKEASYLSYLKSIDDLASYKASLKRESNLNPEVKSPIESNAPMGPTMENGSFTSNKGDNPYDKFGRVKKEDSGFIGGLIDGVADYVSDIVDYTKSSLNEGGQTVSFQVEYIKNPTDSFSNSTKEIPLKEMFNSTASSLRDFRFSVADFDIAGGVIAGLSSRIKDVSAGALDSVTIGLSGFANALSGSAFMEFPLMWDDSETTIAQHDFKVRLGGPYGNPISLLLDQDIPLSYLLAGALPKETGRSSYTSPYLCSAFMRGKVNIDLGMITSITITRGVSHLHANNQSAPLDLDVTFTVSDLSPIVKAPVSGTLLGFDAIISDEYSGLARYLKLLSGQSYTYTKFASKKIALRYASRVSGLASMFSPEGIGMRTGDLIGFLRPIMPDNSGISLANS